MRPTHLPNPHKLGALLVYGDRQIADTLAELFAACGQEVLVACDGTTAWELARTHRPEVVFLDLRMQGQETRQLEFADAALVIGSLHRGQTPPNDGTKAFICEQPIDFPLHLSRILPAEQVVVQNFCTGFPALVTTGFASGVSVTVRLDKPVALGFSLERGPKTHF